MLPYQAATSHRQSKIIALGVLPVTTFAQESWIAVQNILE